MNEEEVFAATTVNDDMIVLKKPKYLLLKKDLILLKELREAWREIDNGKSKTFQKTEFLQELEKW